MTSLGPMTLFYVTSNTRVQQGLTWKTIAWAFRSTEGEKKLASLDLDIPFVGFPAVWLETAGPPLDQHLLFHTANTVLSVPGLERECDRCRLAKFSLWPALFGWHPLHVESVALVSGTQGCFDFALFSGC